MGLPRPGRTSAPRSGTGASNTTVSRWPAWLCSVALGASLREPGEAGAATARRRHVIWEISVGLRSAIGSWVRSDWRRRRVSLLALTLLTSIAFGVVATVFAGARRTASSFDRLRTATAAYDHGIVIDAPGTNPGHPRWDHYDAATIRRIERLPEIATAGGVVSY